MRIVISDFISLDGVVQAPGGAQEDTDGGFAHGGWSLPYFDVAAMGPVLEDVMQRTAALLFGRRTWETMAAAWPGRAGDPFADRMNAIPKYVASRSLTQADLAWSNSSLLPADDVLGAVGAMRDRRLMIEPVTLGGGKRLFLDDGRARQLELVSTTVSATGVHICTYRPTGR